LLKKAQAIHSKIVTIDTHTDTPLQFTRENFDFSGESATSRGRVDLKKMEQGGLDAAFFAVFIGQGDRNPEKYADAHNRAVAIFDALHKTIDNFPTRASIALKSSDAKTIKKEGKRAIYIGVENGYPIGLDLSILKDYYDRGARYVTLCHTQNNDICDSSTDSKGPEHNGLSPFGIEVVAELNRLGMLVDVSHISDKAFYDVLEHSKTPIIASHSSVRAVCDNPRNLTDDMLLQLKKNGGVIQICFLSSYVKTPEPNPARDSAIAVVRTKWGRFQELDPETRKKAMEEWYAVNDAYPQKLATVSDLVNHIDHVVKTIGIDYVGIGTDFDGGGGIDGCKDASEMINVTVELLRRGYSTSDIEKIWGGNFLRVFRQVENFAKSAS
jgi:membrane dipeptidase